MHDPDTYEDPHIFRPERFVQNGKPKLDVRDPYDFVFGFGRRQVHSFQCLRQRKMLKSHAESAQDDTSATLRSS